MPLPLRLSDEQMSAILAACHPLERHAREPFLCEVAQLLQTEPELGDGSLHRLLVVVQRKFFDPPTLEGGERSKYR